ncbi:MAG TPA: hypothetical protein VFG68_05515 [Fimbriiglobus sp.]|nr:hypothetical protein [Fimbriiglobus sp.]
MSKRRSGDPPTRGDVALRPDQLVDAQKDIASLDAMTANTVVRGWVLDLAAKHADAPPRPGLRLSIDLDRLTVTLDGVTCDVRSILALRWLRVLADRPGVWVSGRELAHYDAQLDGALTSRLKKKLPECVRPLIRSESGRGSKLDLS